MELFWEQGYEATGMAQLVDHLGIGRQSLYNAFGNKHALYLQALEAYNQAFVDRVIELLAAPGSPSRNLRTVCHAWEQMLTESQFKGCLLANSSALGRNDEGVRKIVASAYQRLEQAFFRTIQRAKEEGELDSSTDARGLARLFVNTGQGLAVTSQVTEPRFGKAVVRSLLALLPEEK